MLVSYNWLKTYLPKLPPADTLSELLMLHGLDVEGTTNLADRFNNVVVGEIVAIKPHPNADKLRLADVVIAPKGEPQEIVCGAPNIEVGQKVPVALIGATLPNGLTIESRAIRGVTSNGMLCAADELGLSGDHSGVLILDLKTKVGTPLAEALGEDDVVFDVTTPANRADLMSMRGMAWEIGAMLGQKVKFPEVSDVNPDGKSIVSVDVVDAQLSPTYTLRVIRGVQNTTSPQWLQQRLRAVGMRPINAIVDVTNYIMMEYGQPLHAFDAAKVEGKKLTVTFATAGESLTTLDGKTRTLDSTFGVIADPHGPIALAGVMGGQSTEVSDGTTGVYLEAAIFNPVMIRKISRQLGLVSEASKRFEKGLWPELTLAASEAAAALIVELCGGEVEGVTVVGETTQAKKSVDLNPTIIADRLGQKISLPTSKKILTSLGFYVTGTSKQWTVSVPAWRLDVRIPEDIIDEVGRMTGYDELPEVKLRPEEPHDLPKTFVFIEALRNILVELGYTEVISHAFYSDKEAAPGQHFIVANPLDATQHELRKSLIPQIAVTLEHQANAGHDTAIFEIGRVFNPELPGSIEQQQPWRLALGLAQKGEPNIEQAIEALGQRLGIISPKAESQKHGETFRGRTIAWCEFDLHILLKDTTIALPKWDPTVNVSVGQKIREQSKYPAVIRDIAFWWSGDEAAFRSVIDDLHIDLLRDYTVKDRFTKDDRTSFALSFVYQSLERTLTKVEVDTMEAQIKNALTKAGAEIR